VSAVLLTNCIVISNCSSTLYFGISVPFYRDIIISVIIPSGNLRSVNLHSGILSSSEFLQYYFLDVFVPRLCILINLHSGIFTFIHFILCLNIFWDLYIMALLNSVIVFSVTKYSVKIYSGGFFLEQYMHPTKVSSCCILYDWTA